MGVQMIHLIFLILMSCGASSAVFKSIEDGEYLLGAFGSFAYLLSTLIVMQDWGLI